MGCILYALCYFKSPFDTVYERGDSVALAVMSAHVIFPEGAPYNEVVLCFVRYICIIPVARSKISRIFALQDMQSLILSMLKVNSMERPYIYSVIENVHDTIAKLENRV